MDFYREFDGYELNLVIDNEAAPRVNLASLSDWQWVRETGGRIAVPGRAGDRQALPRNIVRDAASPA